MNPSDGGLWGSDLVADVLHDLGVRYVANVPGSSYRGLHDSIVNHLGNREPELVLTLHEEAAVAIAHGYAKITEQPMAAALHANVGLLRAPMAIYNAWCDRAPVLVLGATGPWDAAQRRWSTEWVHTSADQGGVVRAFTKWDDQPASPAAAEESLLRAVQLARTAPYGPVYVNLDATVQEQPLDVGHKRRDVARYAASGRAHPSPASVTAATELLAGATRPLLLVGRCSRRTDDWDARIELAERLGAKVMTDILLAAAFPTDHPRHPVPPLRRAVPPAARELVRSADVVLALDWPHVAHLLSDAYGADPLVARVINASCDVHNHRGGSLDHGALPPSDVTMLCDGDAAVEALLDALPNRVVGTWPTEPRAHVSAATPASDGMLATSDVGRALAVACADRDVCFTRLPRGWDPTLLHFRHPLDSIGDDGGSGVGSGPGITVGAALALRDSGRLPIAVLGDGDFVMGNAALWTAAHHRLGCLFVVCNNRSFYADERHQAHVAETRGRSRENQWIGARLEDPDIDLAGIGRAQGAVGIGPVTDATALRAAIDEGIAVASSGTPCVVDVHVARLPEAGAPSTGRSQVRKWRRRVLPTRRG